ncbi:MAG: tRNA pseudouridine(38-40) synthase TruA [Nitrospirota bacterium]
MKNIKLLIQYDGTNYAGWQRQKDERTIQGVIEDVIKRVTGENLRLIPSGRTDAGVHALGQVANFKTVSKPLHQNLWCEGKIEGKRWKDIINASLPEDIKILDSAEVDMDFHARYSARGRLYSYTILNQEDPITILRNYVWHIRRNLNVEAMIEAGRFLTGEHDFSSFRASACTARKTARKIAELRIEKRRSFIVITIEANAFLHHMVRNIVGTLVEVGRGRLSPDAVREILSAKDRNLAGPTAPARGLILMGVKY